MKKIFGNLAIGFLIAGCGSDAPPESPRKAEAANETISLEPIEIKKFEHYKDGHYSAVGSYLSGQKIHKIEVSLTLENEKIADKAVRSGAQTREERKKQLEFVQNLDIEDASLNDIDSENPGVGEGFNRALNAIRIQAANE